MAGKLHILTTKFVERVLRGVEPSGRYKDGGNLYCVVRGDAASWVFLRVIAGKQKVYTIGSVRKLADLAGVGELSKRALASLTEARAKAAEYRLNIATGKPAKAIIKSEYPSLDDVVEYYCEFKKSDRKICNSFLAPFQLIYDEYGPRFSKDMGVAFREYLKKTGKSDNTILTYMRQVKGMFSIYISDKSVEIINPLNEVRFQKDDAAINNRDPLPLDVIKKVYDALEGDYKKLWLLLVVTGARLNEIYGLKGSDIRADGFLNIELNKRRRLKNKASRRQIPLFFKPEIRKSEYYFGDLGTISNLSQKFQVHINKHIPAEMRGQRRLTTHSCRHSITDYMRLKNVQQNIEDYYLGHAAKDTSSGNYGSSSGNKLAMKQNLEPVITEYLKDIGITLE